MLDPTNRRRAPLHVEDDALRRSALAPAKVNLFLHVGPLDAHGYHPVVSLMSFADVGDRLHLSAADAFSFAVDGEFAPALAGEDPARNLVWRAAHRLLDVAGVAPPPLRLTLDKALPVAAGVGGGSSDAGAALKLLRDALNLGVDDEALLAIAAELGADGPACLVARPVVGEGRGDRLSPAPATPPLPAVLVNPRQPCSTGQVYRAFDALPTPERGADAPGLAAGYANVAAVVELLTACRNDLEPPALQVCPAIAEVLAELRAAPETRLARLSGSGATCFALCDTLVDAEALAATLRDRRPDWWVRACRLGGPWPDDISEGYKHRVRNLTPPTA
jgi:4-diphosphocytidyl-2-C-methyl-D-erythritol kinase